MTEPGRYEIPRHDDVKPPETSSFAVENVGTSWFLNVSKTGPPMRSREFEPPVHPTVVNVVNTTPDPSGPKITGTMSQGTAAQLMSIGPQDRFISLNPQMTFFRKAYRRHTNFAVECFEENFTTDSFVFGTTNVCSLGKHGDLLGNISLRVVLPNLGIAGGTWVDAVGYVLFTAIRMRIGETVVQTHERLWYDIEDKLFLSEGHIDGVNAMIGRGVTLATDSSHEIYVPLKLMCCDRNSGRQQFVPSMSLDHWTNVVIEIDAENLDKCVNLPTGTSLPSINPDTGTSVSSTSGYLLVDNVYVDAIERRRFSESPTTLMFEAPMDIDQVSYTTTTEGTVPMSTVTIDMRELNMPVRYFAIVVYPETYETAFAYLDEIRSGTFFIGADRQFSIRSQPYFSYMQPYDHFTRITSNVAAYSFALDAGGWQPNGCLNFAALSSPTFKFTLKDSGNSRPLKVKLFASCINWVNFHDGKCALGYDS